LSSSSASTTAAGRNRVFAWCVTARPATDGFVSIAMMHRSTSIPLGTAGRHQRS
jgi:hypothetical protein